MTSLDSFKCQKTLKVGGKTYVYYSLPAAEKNGLNGISKLPYSMKVLLENLLRNEDGRTVKKEDILAVGKWLKKRKLEHEMACRRWSISRRCATRCSSSAATPRRSIRWCRSISSSTIP
jgi:aconitate hydratase